MRSTDLADLARWQPFLELFFVRFGSRSQLWTTGPIVELMAFLWKELSNGAK